MSLHSPLYFFFKQSKIVVRCWNPSNGHFPLNSPPKYRRKRSEQKDDVFCSLNRRYGQQKAGLYFPFGTSIAQRPERQPQIGGLKEVVKRESKLAAEKSAKVRRIAPIYKALKFEANAVPGSLSGEETGEI